MSARFRIRTSQGQELSFATHEMFAEFVRSGDLSPDDVVYDAETKEWAPSRTHPLVLQLEYEAEEAAEAEAAEAEPVEASGPAAEGASDGGGSSAGGMTEQPSAAGDDDAEADLGLELAPAPQELSKEEATAQFVARLEAERASELDFDTDADAPVTGGFKIDAGPASIVDELTEPAPPPPPPRAAPRPRPKPVKKPPERTKKKKKPGKAARYAPFVIVVVVLGALGAYFGPELLAPAAGGGAETTPDPEVVTPPVPPPVVAATEEALRERAQERFLSATRVLLRDLEPIPEAWLTGPYLAAPSDFTDVRAAWAAYLTTIRDVRVGDEERYRVAYTAALDGARLEGEARAQRLATALAGFQSTQAARVAHYDQVEAMSSAAIQGHDALVEAEGTISVGTAISGPAATADPVIEAVGRGPDAQGLLDQVLELLLGRLHEDNGPGNAANVREWVYDGLLDAVTN